jgi:hypothetical protein
MDLIREDDKGIIQKYEELEIYFDSMLSIGDEILDQASPNDTILNSAELYGKLVLLAGTSDLFFVQVYIYLTDPRWTILYLSTKPSLTNTSTRWSLLRLLSLLSAVLYSL